MNTQQPRWCMIANLGDVNPIEYGGLFVYVDQTKQYAPEAELLVSPDSDDSPEGWTLYRFILEPCTYQDGVLSDNSSHPEYPAWFATPEPERADRPQDTTYLSNVATANGTDVDDLIRLFCSDDPRERAIAWRAVGDHHGFDNLDQYPYTYHKRSQLPRRVRRYGEKRGRRS